MSYPSREHLEADFIDWLLKDLIREFGRSPTHQEIENAIQDGDWEI